jgi:hypothetical protein
VLLSFLNKAYPYIPSKRPAWLNNLFIGIFVALFLIIFQPFDLSIWQTPNKTLKLIGFGLVSFLMPTLFGWMVFKLVPKHQLEDDWKVWKEILLVLGVLLSIALGNLVYAHLIRITDLSLRGFLNSVVVTVLVGLFPVALAILNKYHRLLRLNLEEAKQANEQIAHPHLETVPQANNEQAGEIKNPGEERVLRLIAENEKDQLQIPEKDLLYIESQDNYASVVYCEGNQLKKQLLRSSLKRLENQIQSNTTKRCHRTFLVNLSKVMKVEGNAAGYTLSLSETNMQIPVSRNYAPAVMQYFKTGA